MSLREWINSNPAAGAAGAVALLVVALGAVWYVSRGETLSLNQPQYYYDMTTGELYLGEASMVPPAEAPSGPGNGARAYVYGCDGCPQPRRVTGLTPQRLSEEHNAFVARIEIYHDVLYEIETTDPANLSAAQIEMMQPEDFRERHTLVRTVDADANEWAPRNSPPGRRLMSPQWLREQCEGGGSPEHCPAH